MKSKSIRWTRCTECIAKSTNSYSVMVGESKDRKPLGSPSHRRQDNIKTVFSGIGLHDVNWIDPAYVVCCG
jgi:hypothetical protein